MCEESESIVLYHVLKRIDIALPDSVSPRVAEKRAGGRRINQRSRGRSQRSCHLPTCRGESGVKNKIDRERQRAGASA
ncbi:hypothetical protein TNCV_969511 [Trichonephila clavipes]|nr:hypothetical protein TNCV_969511 [Trichonephila clavipes]